MAPIVTTSRTKKHSKIGIVYTLATIVVLAIVILFISRKNTSLEVKTEVEQPKEITKSLEPPAKPKNLEVNPKEEKPLEANELEPKPTPSSELTKKPGQITLPDGQILTFTPPKNGDVKKIISSGKIYECDSKGNFKDITPQMPFDNSFENLLVELSIEDGMFVPGLLMGYSTDDVMFMLKKDVIINDDDPDDIKAKKNAVAEIKKIILEYIEGGGTFEEFVHSVGIYSAEERKIKRNGIHKIIRLINDDKIEDARLFEEEFNKVLQTYNFGPLKLPKKIKDALVK